MFSLLAAQIQGFPINTPTMQKHWPAGYPNMIKSYKDASAEVSLGGWAERQSQTPESAESAQDRE